MKAKTQGKHQQKNVVTNTIKDQLQFWNKSISKKNVQMHVDMCGDWVALHCGC